MKRRSRKHNGRLFSEILKAAKKVLKDKKNLKALLAYVAHFIAANRDRLESVWEDLQCILRLVHAWATGRYKKAPHASLILMVSLLIYVVAAVKGFPWLLDTAVELGLVGWMLKELREELAAFRAWEASQPKEVLLVPLPTAASGNHRFIAFFLRLLGPGSLWGRTH